MGSQKNVGFKASSLGKISKPFYDISATNLHKSHDCTQECDNEGAFRKFQEKDLIITTYSANLNDKQKTSSNFNQ